MSPILWMGTLRSEVRNSPRSHDSEVGNWKLNAHFREFIVWAPDLLSGGLLFAVPYSAWQMTGITKRKPGRGSDLPSNIKISNFASKMFCPLCFADSQIWRHCILNDALTSSVSSLGSRILSEHCLAYGSMNICWMNEYLFTNFHTAFGHKVPWYIALGRYFWLIFVGIFK